MAAACAEFAPSPTPNSSLCSVFHLYLCLVLEPFHNCGLSELGTLGTVSSFLESPEPILGAKPLPLVTCSFFCPGYRPVARLCRVQLLGFSPSSIMICRFSQNACLASASLPPSPCHGIVCLRREAGGRASKGRRIYWEMKPGPQAKKLPGQQV